MPSWAPNLHPLIVHFPIVLLILAVVVDLLDTVLERPATLGAAATSLYVTGAFAAIGSFLTGREAASTVFIPGMAHPSLQDHRIWALATTWYVSAVVLVRLVWRFTSLARIRRHRVWLLAVGLIGAVMVYQTAERGARLVYEYGVGVIPTPYSP